MYRCRHFAAALAGAAFFVLPGLALADPMVIQGVGSQYNVPQTTATAADRQMTAAAPQTNGLGGGLFEFLVTGRSSGQPRASYTPAPQPASLSAHYEADGQPRRTIDPLYLRQEVEYNGHEKPGTIVIDSPNKFLFLVQPGGRALRYGIGVGRPGFTWSGIKTISRKAEWPDWTPPVEMLARRPDLPTHMDGGPANPLGARAMYLGSSL
jgi:lipoprotein-anchoring transpeptidase ErfK/SrfK